MSERNPTPFVEDLRAAIQETAREHGLRDEVTVRDGKPTKLTVRGTREDGSRIEFVGLVSADLQADIEVPDTQSRQRSTEQEPDTGRCRVEKHGTNVIETPVQESSTAETDDSVVARSPEALEQLIRQLEQKR